MLSLQREVGQSIMIGDDIEVVVTDIRDSRRVRLSITAPREVTVDRKEVAAAKSAGSTSGTKRSAEMTAWYHMIDRCYNPRSQRFDRYGARGITVCEHWRTSFPAFLEDMGDRPGPEYSLDRINNDGNYEPGNCRWATRGQQAVNTSSNVNLRFRDVTLTISQWSRILGIGHKTLSCRLESGWSVDEALSTPTEGRVWTKHPGRRRRAERENAVAAEKVQSASCDAAQTAVVNGYTAA